MAESVETPPLEKPVPDESKDPRGVRAQPPPDLAPLKLGSPKVVAGGIPAIFSSMRHALGEAGPIRGTKLLLAINQKDGFDCPGCAWPDPDGHRALTEFCENGAKAVAEEGTAKEVGPEFFARYGVRELGERSDFWLGKQGRLTHPMVLLPGASHYQSIRWDKAYALIATHLNALESPNQAIFYTSGRASNEAAFLYQLFVREYGTNNLPDCSNMCHESSGSGLVETIGIGKGTVKLEDFAKAQVVVVIGQNPGTNHPRMLSALQETKRAGGKVVSVNPLPEAGLIAFKHPQEVFNLLGKGTALADLFLQVRINGDVALLQGLGKAIIEANGVDESFVRERTEQYAAYAAALARVGWDEIVKGSGLDEAKIRELAQLLIESERIIFCWAMGLTQHENAVDNVREIVNVLLLRGAMGKPGAGVCPVRGHSNVQGDRTMGIYEKPAESFLAALDKATGISAPRAHGLDVVEAISAMHDGRARVFLALGGNFLSATPDTEFTAAALRRTDLTVQISTKLNRAHLVAGKTALILPCLGRTDHDKQASGVQFVTTENSMGVVQMSRGRLRPLNEEQRSEPSIVAGIAQATLNARTKMRWAWLAADYDRIRDLIAPVIPGFNDFNQRVRIPGGFYLPNGPRDGVFLTSSGRARFTVHALPKQQLLPGQLLMMTVRSHDQYNTTIYGLADRYRGLANERRVVLLNREDIAALGLHERQVVDLTSHFRGETRTVRRFVVVGYEIPRGCACTYFPEANALVPLKQVAHTSNTPASKSVVITVAPATEIAPFDPERTPEAQLGTHGVNPRS